MMKVNRIPEGLDLTDLKYLQYGDLKRVAKELGKPEKYSEYLSKIKRGEAYNVKALAALLKQGKINRLTINQH